MSTTTRRRLLEQLGLLHPRPETVTAPLFNGREPFFLSADKVQVKYEMLRAHVVEGVTATAVAEQHGYSRAAFYLIMEAFEFLEQAANIIVIGPNGLGKSMIAKNLLHQAVLRGYTARFTAASDMLHDLAAQDSSTQRARRLRRYTTPALLCCDEVGY